ncbi:UvrD-helicase domain-containing protein [Candidatus Woesearchaeota archaeon]|nr:UvrD-helicase domain-containing protein [Candidatus Woesearchaeota archaeon]
MNDDHVKVLKAIDEMPFGVGKKLLVDYLSGSDNDSIKRNKLFKLPGYASLAYSEDELNMLIDKLLLNGYIVLNGVPGKPYWKVLGLTDKGNMEMEHPNGLDAKYDLKETTITDKDKQAFKVLDRFLGRYNEYQKKAIISPARQVLCIAGAGSGKTTVLTKRIEFLIKYRSVDPGRILAITFTRKARQEMLARLIEYGVRGVSVETFNSFSEKMLRIHNDKIYDRDVRVIGYKDKINIIRKALRHLKISVERAMSIYFPYSQLRSKSDEELFSIFLNDMFFLRDYLKSKDMNIGVNGDGQADRLVSNVAQFIEEYMNSHGFRDFSDQLMDTLGLFDKHKDVIPDYEHILIDEYQDVNSSQIRLIDVLNAENVFAVGDPRQSIFGWRGSDIGYILKFKGEKISLVNNYRSSRKIVDFMNMSVKSMGLQDLESVRDEGEVRLIKYNSEDEEYQGVINSVLSSGLKGSDIFILARTNRQLKKLSELMTAKGILHKLRNEGDEETRDVVTLSTVHAIKGMEAKLVFVIGCTRNNFPCKGSEHPVVDMIDVDEYDKAEEEKRLFYVAVSRAMDSLKLSYSGKSHTYYITDAMVESLGKKPVSGGNKVVDRLKEWRSGVAARTGLPAYMILHDKTLIDISVKMPMDLEDLRGINGLGPEKIMKYGEDILDVMS